MDSLCRGLFIFWICFIGFSSCQVTINTVEPVREGETVTVVCNATGKIASCSWEINGDLIMPGASAPLRLVSDLSEMQCGVQAEVNEKLNGNWVCKVFLEGGPSLAQSASTNVALISVPTISMQPATERLTVVVGEEKQVICEVKNARPVPSIVWKIGNRTLDEKEYTTSPEVGKDGKAIIKSVLRHEFVTMEHGKDLRCIVEGSWFRNDDVTEAKTFLDIELCQVTINTVKPVREGETVTVVCNATGKIASCLWEISGDLIMPGANAPLRLVSDLSEMQCGVQAEVNEKLNGNWICKVFLEGGPSLAQSASTKVALISVPTISMRPATERLTVVVGEEKQVICEVKNARPVPSIVWKIGNRTLDEKEYTTSPQEGKDGKAIINSVLRHEFVAMEYGKDLRCIAEGSWFGNDDVTEAKTFLDIQFPPIPQHPIYKYESEENSKAEVQVTVQSNPRPYRAFWILPTLANDKLEVEDQSESNEADTYKGVKGTDNGNGTYTYKLYIDSVQPRDSNPGLKLQVYTKVGYNEVSEQYTVHVVPQPPPTQAGLSGGGIAGIIIALIALVVIVALVMYARNTGKFCFAGAVQPTGQSDDAEKGKAEEASEACRKPGLGDRLSAVYENICNRTQKKKGERLTATESELQKLDPEQVEQKHETDGVVYAELNLKEATQPGIVRSEEPNEYAEIVGIAKMKENEEKEPEEKESPKPI